MLRKMLSHVAAVALVLGGMAAHGAEVRQFNIPPGELASALESLAKETGLEVIFEPEKLKGVHTSGVTGKLSPEEAVERLVNGTGLTVRMDIAGAILISGNSAADDARLKLRLAQAVSRADAGAAVGGPGDDASAKGGKLENTGQTTELQEVVVTAEKREERLQDVPVPVSVLDGQALADRGQSQLRDYYASIPGLTVAPSTFSQQLLSIRGIAGGGNPTVGITVDDVPFGGSTGPTLSAYVPDFDPGDLARVEVLRGPQGTLYGSASMGGLIKFVTVDPSLDSYGGRVEAGTSVVANGSEPGFNLRGSANLPLGDTLAARISGYVRQDPGYIDNPFRHVDGVNDGQAAGGRLSVLWQPSAAVSLKLGGIYQYTKADGASEVQVGPGFGDLQQNYIPGAGSYERVIQVYSAVLKVNMGGVDLTSVTGYNQNHEHPVVDYSSVYGTKVLPLYGVSGVAYNSYDETDKISQELRLSGTIRQALDWRLGLFYTHEKNDPDVQNFVAEDPLSGQVLSPVYWYFVSHREYDESAAFADITYRFTDSFDVQAGGRESHVRSSFSGIATGPLIGPPGAQSVTLPELTDNNVFTYLLTPRLRLSPDIMLYARLASGFRPGSPNGVAPPGVVTPKQSDPDRTENYEIGAKGDFLDHRLILDASVYRIDWKDIQLNYKLGGFGFVANGGGAKSQGAELTVTAMPLRGLTLTTWVSYDDAVLTEPLAATATLVGATGARLQSTPRLSGDFAVNQDIPLGPEISGFMGGEVSYVGDRLGAFQAAGVLRPAYPAYAKIDLHGGVKSGSWTTTLYVNNLANKRGALNGGTGYIPSNAYVYITPRTIGISAVKTF